MTGQKASLPGEKECAAFACHGRATKERELCSGDDRRQGVSHAVPCVQTFPFCDRHNAAAGRGEELCVEHRIGRWTATEKDV